MLPLLHPLYNLREACKQAVLLEDHLFSPEKRCPDCIRKHFLTLEALLDEALTLDSGRAYGELLAGRAGAVRELAGTWNSGADPVTVAQGLRALRKAWVPVCFGVVWGARSASAPGLARHVASVYAHMTQPHWCARG